MHCRLLLQVSYCEKANGLTPDDVVKAMTVIFEDLGLLKKITSDGGTNFMSNMFRQMSIEQAITPS